MNIYHHVNWVWSKIYKFLIFNNRFNDIARDAIVPDSTQFPHKGIGVVIGSGTILGENVTVYHHVTLGDRHKNNGAGPAPVVEDNVILYAGAYVLGGVTVGEGAVVGAKSLVLKDVPSGMIVKGVWK